MSNSKELKKSIGFFAALSTVIGIVIGSGVFFKPNAVFSAAGAPGLGILAWVIAGLITIAAGLTAAELAASIPKTGGAIQTISTLCKLIPLFLIMFFSFIKGDGSISTSLTPITNPNLNVYTALGTALLGVLFAYEGWLSVGNLAGEMKNPKKDLPKAIVLGVSIVMFVYVAINIAYLWVIPADKLATSLTPASDVARVLFGDIGGKFITFGIIISVFGTLNALVLTAPRALYTLSLDKKYLFIIFYLKSQVNKFLQMQFG